MIEVSATHPDLSVLFDPQIPNNPMLFATLLGHNPGRAFVDDAIHPSQCVVITNEALVFVSKEATQEFLDEALAHIKQFGHIAVIWSSPTFALEIPPADRTIERLEFPAYDFQTLASIKNDLPGGFEFRMIDKELLERCEWRQEVESFCGSLENFLAHGFGVCLMHEDEIITEAYAPFVAVQNVEIGAVTRENYRGHGYGAITCAYLIQICRERGFEPYWSCDADNAASVSLARKLGFQDERQYEIRMYRGILKATVTSG